MPEIAEVALTAEILNDKLRNKKLLNLEFEDGKYTKKHPVGYNDFISSLPLKLLKVDSRGKFLWFELTKIITKKDENNQDNILNNKWYIWNTLGLNGMWSFFEPKYKRATLTFSGDTVVYFSDMINYGTFKFSNNEEELAKKLKKLSPDFLKDNDFDLSKIKKYNIPVVKILMDQTKVGSGIGNYLVAEILYRAGISPHRLGSSLTDEELDRLKYWIKYVIKLSYEHNDIGYMVNLKEELPTHTKRKYHKNIKLKDKAFDFLVYKQKFDPLGNPVITDKIVTSGKTKRSTYWVPAVQK